MWDSRSIQWTWWKKYEITDIYINIISHLYLRAKIMCLISLKIAPSTAWKSPLGRYHRMVSLDEHLQVHSSSKPARVYQQILTYATGIQDKVSNIWLKIQVPNKGHHWYTTKANKIQIYQSVWVHCCCSLISFWR